MTTMHTRGGARRGAGRNVVDIQLDLESARSLKIIVLAHGLDYNKATADRVVRDLIEAEWRRLDAEYLSETTA